MGNAFRESDTILFRDLVTFQTGFGVVADEPFLIGSDTTTGSFLKAYNTIYPYGGISGYVSSGSGSSFISNSGFQTVSGALEIILTGYLTSIKDTGNVQFSVYREELFGFGTRVIEIGDNGFFLRPPGNNNTHGISIGDLTAYNSFDVPTLYWDGDGTTINPSMLLGAWMCENLFVSGYPVVNSSQTGNFINTGMTGRFASTGNLFSTGNVLSIWTGNSTNIYYPKASNPSGYITSGQTGSFLTISNTGFLTGAFYPLNSNPTNYVTSSQTGILLNTGSLYSSWSNLTWGTTTIWTGSNTVIEDKRILILTGNTTLNISGLFNGWCGILQTIQSGTSSSGYSLTLPNSTRVINGASGIASLTRTSGAIDMLGFTYDGSKLFLAIGNNFN